MHLQSTDSVGNTIVLHTSDISISRIYDENPHVKEMMLTGVSPTEHSVTGLEPVEPVFEQITWQAKSAIITAGNSESSEM